MEISDTRQLIANHLDVLSLLTFCKVNKSIYQQALTTIFWYHIYQSYDIPINRIQKNRKYKYYMNAFIHSYNSMLFAKYIVHDSIWCYDCVNGFPNQHNYLRSIYHAAEFLNLKMNSSVIILT